MAKLIDVCRVGSWSPSFPFWKLKKKNTNKTHFDVIDTHTKKEGLINISYNLQFLKVNLVTSTSTFFISFYTKCNFASPQHQGF